MKTTIGYPGRNAVRLRRCCVEGGWEKTVRAWLLDVVLWCLTDGSCRNGSSACSFAGAATSLGRQAGPACLM